MGPQTLFYLLIKAPIVHPQIFGAILGRGAQHHLTRMPRFLPQPEGRSLEDNLNTGLHNEILGASLFYL